MLVCVFVDVNVYLYVCKRKNDEKQQVVAAKKTSLALTSEQQAKGRHLTIHREREKRRNKGITNTTCKPCIFAITF